MYAESKYVSYAVRYVNPKLKSANNEWVKKRLDCGFVKTIIYICVYQYCCAFENSENIII